MSCIVKPGTVIKYISDYNEIYYYALDDIVNSECKICAKCVSSTGDLFRKCHFNANTILDDCYENIEGKLLEDCFPEEGELYLYRDAGEWRVLKYTKYSIGYWFDSLTNKCSYNMTGNTLVYPLTGITESMLIYDKLTEEYHILQESYDDLSNCYNHLSSDYDILAESNGKLVADYNMLKEQKADLEKKVDYYYDQCKHLKDGIDSIKKNPVSGCKYWDGVSCTCVTEDVEPYKEEIERLKNLVIKLTEELMERR